MSYKENFSLLYDSIYSSKNYETECNIITSVVGENKKILDVGCGTGKHTSILSKTNKVVHGIDISKDMIEVAKQKYLSLDNVSFENICIDKYVLKNDEKYDAVICMFNVVNHISKLKNLNKFLNSCSKKIKQNGYIIFDCWNSIACAIEKPWPRTTDYKVINDDICMITTLTDVDIMNSQANMKITIESTTHGKKQADLKLDNLTLWSPRIFKEILFDNGILTENILNFKDFKKNAKQTDHRILFIGRKK